jgi:hypothetical protein
MLRHRLKLSEKIYARNCIIKELQTKEEIKLRSKFINENHIQGNSGSTIKLGLFLKDSEALVSVMTFGIPRYQKISKNSYELIRFCSLKNNIVIGGASKLLKYFISNYKPDNIISYANRNFSSSLSNVYKVLGFDKINTNISNLKIINTNNTNISKFNRQSFTKEKTKKIFKLNNIEYIDSKSVNYNLINNNYRLLYEAGTDTYLFMYNKNLIKINKENK